MKLKSKLSASCGIWRAWSIRLRNQDQTSSIYVSGRYEGSTSIRLPMLSSFSTILTRESIELQRGLLSTVSFFSSERNTSFASRKVRMLSQFSKVSRRLFQCSSTCEKRGREAAEEALDGQSGLEELLAASPHGFLPKVDK